MIVRLDIVAGRCNVVLSNGIARRRMECQTDTQFINRLYDNTEFEINARTECVERILYIPISRAVFHAYCRRSFVGNEGVLNRFAVICIERMVKVEDSKTCAPIERIIYVTAETDRILIGLTAFVNGKSTASRRRVVEKTYIVADFRLWINKIRIVSQNTCPWQIRILIRVILVSYRTQFVGSITAKVGLTGNIVGH